MDSKHWFAFLMENGLVNDEGYVVPLPGTILTIHVADSEVSLKDSVGDITVLSGDQIMTVTSHATGFVQYLPWDGVTKIEQRRADDHRYRHGPS